MSWAKFSDDWFTSPLITSLSDKATVLAAGGATYIARHLTDGLIPLTALPAYTSGRLAPAIRELIAAGVWTPYESPTGQVQDGFATDSEHFHYVFMTSWNNHSMSAEKVTADKAASAERQAKQRSCSSGACAKETGRSHKVSDCPASRRESHSESQRPVHSRPVPSSNEMDGRDRDRDRPAVADPGPRVALPGSAATAPGKPETPAPAAPVKSKLKFTIVEGTTQS